MTRCQYFLVRSALASCVALPSASMQSSALASCVALPSASPQSAYFWPCSRRLWHPALPKAPTLGTLPPASPQSAYSWPCSRASYGHVRKISFSSLVLVLILKAVSGIGPEHSRLTVLYVIFIDIKFTRVVAKVKATGGVIFIGEVARPKGNIPM